jgi:hypothetical protein
LPPYSPELNPVENVWAYLRSNKLSNRVFETYEDIVNACCDAWRWFTSSLQSEHVFGHASVNDTERIIRVCFLRHVDRHAVVESPLTKTVCWRRRRRPLPVLLTLAEAGLRDRQTNL